jgi:hypothetical protein
MLKLVPTPAPLARRGRHLLEQRPHRNPPIHRLRQSHRALQLGPRKIFYNPDGTPITPGNVLFATNGGITLLKPDVTAADGVFAKTPGFLPFFGTSAALVKSANPALTNGQIYTILTTTALDTMTPGADRNSGHGIVMALPLSRPRYGEFRCLCALGSSLLVNSAPPCLCGEGELSPSPYTPNNSPRFLSRSNSRSATT